MPRIRSIHPDALESEKLAETSAEGERLYWRLSTHCDDEGRCKDDPVILAAFLFPRSPEIDGPVIDRWLTELHERGLIVRYEAEGRRLLAVTRWSDYQKPNRPTGSKLPAPPCDEVPAHEPLSELESPTQGEGNAVVGVVGGDGEGVVVVDFATAHDDESSIGLQEQLRAELLDAIGGKPSTAHDVIRELLDEGHTAAEIRAALSTSPKAERGRGWDFANRVRATRQRGTQLTMVGHDGRPPPMLVEHIAARDRAAEAEAVPMPSDFAGRRQRAEASG